MVGSSEAPDLAKLEIRSYIYGAYSFKATSCFCVSDVSSSNGIDEFLRHEGREYSRPS